MNRSRFACLKHIAFALLALAVILCAAEIGLRIHVSTHSDRFGGDEVGDSLIVRSWRTHHRLKPLASARCRNPDTNADVEVTTNSFGLRGPEPEVPKPLGVYRILCLGDETALAPDVDAAQSFCGRLEALLAPHCRMRLEVVNAGVPGFCPLLSYLHLRHSLIALQPDLIVLCFDMGDVADDYRYRRHTNMTAAGDPLACPHPSLVSRDSPDGIAVADQFLLVRWGKAQLGEIQVSEARPEDLRAIGSPQARYAWLTDDPPDWSIHVEQALSPIERLGRLAERHFSRLVVSTYPAPWQVSASASGGPGVRDAAGIPPHAVYRSRRPFDTLKQYAQRRNIAIHDASPAFQTAKDPETLFLKAAARFSAAGHELYARQLARFLYRTVPDVWKADDTGPDSLEPVRHAQSGGR